MATVATFPFEHGIDDFTRTVLIAQQEIARSIELAIRTEDLQTAKRRRLQLAKIIAILDQLGAAVDPIARELVADAYMQGAQRAAAQIIGFGINAPEIPDAFTGVSRDAVIALQQSLTGKLKTSRDIIGRQVDDVYGRAGRRAALRAVLGADGSPQAARRQLVRDLLRDRDIARAIASGAPGFVDVAGRGWNLNTYAEMVVRTTTREAVTQGAVARMLSHGVTIARVSMHASACKICKQYEGRLVDLAGDNRDFDGEAIMTGPLPPFHPNCRHSLAPVAVRIERLRRELAGSSA